MSRSTKQEWVSERCWRNKGSLTGARMQLLQIARAPSTLQGEADSLTDICIKIGHVLATWDAETRRSASLSQFKKYR